MEQIWVIRLINNNAKYLTSYKPHSIRWGRFKHAKTFSSRYKAKILRNEIGSNTACEVYRWEWGLN